MHAHTPYRTTVINGTADRLWIKTFSTPLDAIEIDIDSEMLNYASCAV